MGSDFENGIIKLFDLKIFFQVDEWNQRAHCFQETCTAVTDMFLKFNDIPNRRILQQLYPYIYDLKESVNMLSSFVKWLGGCMFFLFIEKFI